MSKIASTSLIHPSVKIADNVIIEDFCIIGFPPSGSNRDPKPSSIGANSVIRSHTIIYEGNQIGAHFQSGHSVFLRENNKIGEHVSIGTKTVIEHHVEIGSGCRIHSQAFIPEFCILEDEVWIGPNVVLTNSKYPRSKNSKEKLEGVTIHTKAKIGANSTILPGLKIGKNALVGAGSTVTKNVEANKIVFGNPAQAQKEIDQIQDYGEPS